jgi:hypothetical protein
VECGNETQEWMELFQEAHGNSAPLECMIENMELIFEGAPARRMNVGQNPSTESGSAATLNTHGGMTKGGKSAKMLTSTGKVQPQEGDSESDDTAGNDTTMVDASYPTVGNDTVMTNALDPTVGNITVASEDTAGDTLENASDNTPRMKGTKEDDFSFDAMDDDMFRALTGKRVQWVGSVLSTFVPGQQQFPKQPRLELSTEHKSKYLGGISGRTVMLLFEAYTKSIGQPWTQTPHHLQKQVWQETMQWT